MKSAYIVAISLLLIGCGNHQILGDQRDYVRPDTLPAKIEIEHPGKYPPHSKSVWVTESALPNNVQFEILEHIKVKPKWSGTERKVKEKMANRARALGADMIIRTDIAWGHSMFMQSVPVGRGDAIKINSPADFDPTSLAGGWF